MTIAEVQIWGSTIGAVTWNPDRAVADFQYAEAFARGGIEVAPIMMPLSRRVYRFPELNRQTFHGLPGLLADALPDKFGNALIDAWLAREGRSPESFNPVERLCYTGKRGMGALEFVPTTGPEPKVSRHIEISALVELASEVLSSRRELRGDLSGAEREKALRDILRVGTSAGGARAKAVIAWNPKTNEVRSGQLPSERGFEYWLLKFDGVGDNRDKELNDPQGYGAVEYAYFLMARAAGITMSDCRLLEENGRRHFMTRRFDRTAEGAKLHLQSLCALGHYDFNQAGAHAYEQAIEVIRKLELGPKAVEEQVRRACFNIVARNQDDHVKNIAFLMDKQGQWTLSPAYDVTYSYNPSGDWTARHQMTLNGKRDQFTVADFHAFAELARLPRGRIDRILEQVQSTVRRWPEFAAEAKLDAAWAEDIGRHHRLVLPKG